MSSEALGGGVMVAVAATLWVTYLMPTWSRRRQYLAVERNAVRLQQTLRIMAETSEVPQQVRLEANARTVNAQQKLLAQAEDDARAESKQAVEAAAAARRAAASARAASASASAESPALALRRLRKWRALSSLVLLAGLVSLLSGAVTALLSGSWTVLAVGGVAVVAALGSLSRLARIARTARVVAASPIAAFLTAQRFEPVHFDETPVANATWTPQPLPRPLHLSRGSIAQTAMASVDAAAELRKAAAESELALRAARIAAAVTPISRPAAARVAAQPSVASGGPAAVNRFASMGVVGETAPGMTDLDAVLRRRRAVG
ncbi:hypothetical protein [Cryobacterium tagatosivorans]|uniref:Large exoprotein n=1 Tax=Cryobacterium tagatosivorans TaxID=1259199 RepID=A0A4R8UHY6_9MICO|nr:hypothetical protein [Cryobacterium tagatosivorans]TFB55187.1 hypothetical protein E3O23_02885 [Cryobacterium tagatosivorans]